ncbi:heme ABC exporter ATP-binding protein CcmA [Novosphingobium sp. P6W]|uniref:heme ABC exporter ATP-binding protein CcmA n=1 Tax=Novosphingobium sp. P6W TaxID=1609758 RepID=UPI0005C2C032|nr:heme ABC exporter ATP-binding protein CcmA [Novosphingobium sp. P6W]AXB77460.1 heme ABC exporter ATP-binding protein CcmA [Novosphingobium sp. P6W]KIS33830.1 cytochrome C biogenesis protein CcmA [Novosphingobium sp. P6W]
MQEAALSPTSIAVTDLACRRGDRVLFSRLSLNLKAGDALQVAGHNGIGKSSLLRIIAGLAPAFAGSVSVEGTVGLLDERPALDPALPLGRALAFWGALDGLEESKATGDLARLGLVSLLDVPVRYLSTGQKKRAALARLLGQKARVWLLDEPLNGLDGHAVELAETITAQHCAAGGIAVIASHQTLRLPAMRILPLSDFALRERAA